MTLTTKFLSQKQKQKQKQKQNKNVEPPLQVTS